MKRLLPVSFLLPNPYDRGAILPKEVEKLCESFDALKTKPEDIHLRARLSPTDPAMFQVTDGKHRMKAIQAAFGAKTMLTVDILDLSDEQMFRELIQWNYARRTPTQEEWTKIIEEAKNYLIANGPKVCKRVEKQLSTVGQLLPKGRAQGCQAGEHGSARCIAAFLGVEGLSFQKISHFLQEKPEPPPPPVPTQEATSTTIGGMLSTGTEVLKPTPPEVPKMGTAAQMLKEAVAEDERAETQAKAETKAPPPNGKTVTGAKPETGKRGETQLRGSLQKTLSNYTLPNGDLTQYDFICAVERWLQSLRTN